MLLADGLCQKKTPRSPPLLKPYPCAYSWTGGRRLRHLCSGYRRRSPTTSSSVGSTRPPVPRSTPARSSPNRPLSSGALVIRARAPTRPGKDRPTRPPASTGPMLVPPARWARTAKGCRRRTTTGPLHWQYCWRAMVPGRWIRSNRDRAPGPCRRFSLGSGTAMGRVRALPVDGVALAGVDACSAAGPAEPAPCRGGGRPRYGREGAP